MRCKGCNALITGGGKKRPTTTFSGAMMSVYNDSIKEGRRAMRKEDEDLCQRCLESIRGYNNDLTNLPMGEVESTFWASSMFPKDTDPAFEDGRVDSEFQVGEEVYEGWRERGL